MTNFSVKSIAEMVRRPDEPAQTAIDRVRNWTKEGLLAVAGDKHPGTGRARQYGRTAAIEAVLLQVLVDCTGTSAISAAPLVKIAKGLISLEHPRRKDASRTYLVIGKSIGAKDAWMSVEKGSRLAKALAEKPLDTYTLVDVNLLLDRVTLPEA